jgi:WD40 repeat protein
MLIATTTNDGEVLNIGPKGFERSQITFPGANSSLIFSPDGTTFGSVVFNMARNGALFGSEVKVWSIADNKVQETHMIQQDRTIKALAISPDKKTLATGALDNKVRLWDLTAKPPVSRQEFVMPTTWLKSLDFTSDGNFLLAVGANGGHVTLWNAKEGKAEKSWHFVMKKAGMGGGPFSAATFAPDERHVAISTFNNPTTIILRLPARK